MISVVIVDDHPVVRAGLKAVLGTADDISIISEGACGEDAIRLVKKQTPDVLVLDLNLPDINGLEVIRRLREQKNHTAILILTIQRENLSVFELLECGALGYVLKDEALETLVSAVRAAARGENWLSPAIATKVVRRAVNQGSTPDRGDFRPAITSSLTPREMEVLALLARGLDNKEIARCLVLTTRTVQNHVSNIYSKIGTTNRTEAALYAIRNGLAELAR